MLELPIRRLRQSAPIKQRDEMSSVAPFFRDTFEHPVRACVEFDGCTQLMVRDEPYSFLGSFLEPDDASRDVPARAIELVGTPR